MDSTAPDSLIIRLKTFMDHTGLNNSQFADRCNVPRPSFSQIITGRNKKVSDILLTMIHKAFPELNMLWLMFGEGQMLVDNGNDAEKPLELNSDPSSQLSNGESLLYPSLEEGDLGGNFTDFMHGGTAELKNRRENEGNLGDLRLQQADIKRINDEVSQIISREFERVLEKPQRRVVRITVFYDDNSYETFSPTSGQ